MGKIFDKVEQMDLFGESEQEQVDNSLNARYIVPPFSVLDTKQGYWQNRKRQWLKLGIKSDLNNAKTHKQGVTLSATARDMVSSHTLRGALVLVVI